MDDCMSIIVAVVVIIALVMLFWNRGDSFVSAFKNQSNLTPSRDTDTSCKAYKYCDCPADIDNMCQEYLSYVKEGTNKKYCRRLQPAEAPCACFPDDYESIVGENIPIGDIKSHATFMPDKGTCDAYTYCECPPDLDGTCKSDETLVTVNGKKVCRKLQTKDSECTCFPSDFSTITGTYMSNFTPNGEKTNKQQYTNPVLEHAKDCDVQTCSCKRLKNKSCPENWTPGINDTEDLICTQKQNVYKKGCTCYDDNDIVTNNKSTFKLRWPRFKKKHFCSCSSEVPSCGCSDFSPSR